MSCSPGICPRSPIAAAPSCGSGRPPDEPGCCSTAAGSTGRPAGRSKFPSADIEIDFDIESAANGRVYLWGFLVQPAGGPGVYHEFSRFTDLDDADEVELAREAFEWLRSVVETGGRVVVFHYSGYEVAKIRSLADRAADPLLDWAAGYAEEQFVDLLEIVKNHYFGVAGLGLKLMARHAGFSWRDEEPGGLNSQVWFAEAVHAEGQPDRAAARQRVLDYNEDDVLARPPTSERGCEPSDRGVHGASLAPGRSPPRPAPALAAAGQARRSARRIPDPRVAAANSGCQRGKVRLVWGAEQPFVRDRMGRSAGFQGGEDAAAGVVRHHQAQVGDRFAIGQQQTGQVVQGGQVSEQCVGGLLGGQRDPGGGGHVAVDTGQPTVGVDGR